MTSRVQKGGAIFKPVVKARPRASNAPQSTPSATPSRRQSSALPDSQITSQSNPSLPSTSSAARPPLSVSLDDVPPPRPKENVHPPATSRPPAEENSQDAGGPLETPTRSAMPPMLRAAAPTPVNLARASSAVPTVISTPSRPVVPPAYTTHQASPSTPARPPDLQRLPPQLVPSRPISTPSAIQPPAPGSRPPVPITPTPSKPLQAGLSLPASQHRLADVSMAPPAIPSAQPPIVQSQLPSQAIPAASEAGPSQSQTVVPTQASTSADDPPAAAEPSEDEAQLSTSRRTRSKGKKAAPAASQDDAFAPPTRPKRGRKKKSDVTEGEEATEKEARPKRKRRAKTATTEDDEEKPTRKRRKKVPAFDPDADPGEEIDPTTITMAELCEDTGQGRVSSRAMEVQDSWAAWKVRSREYRARLMAKKERKKLGKPEDEEEEEQNATAKDAPEGDSPAKQAVPDDTQATVVEANGDGDEDSDDDFYGNLKARDYTTQVRLGAGASIVIDEESTQVDRAADEDTSGYTHVVEHDRTKFINSSTYTKKVRGSRWSAEETELFYDALRQYGENYELIAIMLPGRDRKSCQNKFKAEDKKNPHLINAALKSNVPIDMQTLSRITGKDFSGPTPEIRAPTPPPQLPVDGSPRSSPEVSKPKVKKRGRSKSALNDGVQVIGSIDDYDMDAD
ncbi:uncharacterized protein SCHCODRAFT_02565147 [Schizophyllum commune H4-8]|nr:uncharacterized protein SCHCODRAFT_02565147 [Schizophyllum commune H4-8]KAI5897825.1 hypothetical protein SCHCODRAFT_02565147 [Schizophyllum commune H4-8]